MIIGTVPWIAVLERVRDVVAGRRQMTAHGLAADLSFLTSEGLRRTIIYGELFAKADAQLREMREAAKRKFDAEMRDRKKAKNFRWEQNRTARAAENRARRGGGSTDKNPEGSRSRKGKKIKV